MLIQNMKLHLLFCIIVLLILLVCSASTEKVRNIRQSNTAKSIETFHKEIPHILKHHKEAYTIWNITNKYRLLNKNNLDECAEEVISNHRLLGPLLVNVTLRDSNVFVYESIMAEHTGMKLKSSDLRHAIHVFSKSSIVIEDEEEYLRAARKILAEIGYDHLFESNCPLLSHCGCVWTKYVEEFGDALASLKDSISHLHEYIVFGTFIDPAVRIPIFIFGSVLNFILLIIFCREKPMRVESNILLFSLCINNILILMIYTPLQYMHMYYRSYKHYFHDLIIFEALVISVNAMTVMCLNVKRYFDVSRVLKPDIGGCRLSPTLRCIVYVSVIWVWSSGIAAFCGFETEPHASAQESVTFILLYLFILSIIVAVFSSLTARKLQRAAEQGQTSTEFQHITGSGVILALTVAFYVVHIPLFILLLYLSMKPDPHEYYFMYIWERFIYFIVFKLFISYPCIILLILYKTCSVYRVYFRKYICRCWYIPDYGEYITMSSLQNAENQDNL
ncbi:hypothetical protein C0J52_22919 [Blattella germanica]|nr:hypothetical protein C0J52_22919 [Blattella germanica]